MTNPSSKKVPINRELIDKAFQAILGQGPDGDVRFVQTDDSGNLQIVNAAMLQALTNTMEMQYLILAELRVLSLLINEADEVQANLEQLRTDVMADVEAS